MDDHELNVLLFAQGLEVKLEWNDSFQQWQAHSARSEYKKLRWGYGKTEVDAIEDFRSNVKEGFEQTVRL